MCAAKNETRSRSHIWWEFTFKKPIQMTSFELREWEKSRFYRIRRICIKFYNRIAVIIEVSGG